MKYTINITIEGKAKIIPFNFPSKKDEKEYIEICENIWGGVPVDIDWATGTKLYKERKEKNATVDQ